MLEKVRQAAADQAKRAADAAQRTASAAADRAVDVAKDPATHARAKLVARQTAVGAGKAAGAAGKAAKSALDKLNPATLAAIVMKATAIQEQSNAVLRRHKSLYRIGGIEIGASFPPSISFQIIRAAELELEEEAMGLLPDEPPGAVDAETDAILAQIDAADGDDAEDDADDAGETNEKSREADGS
jgi:hypothetical protein